MNVYPMVIVENRQGEAELVNALYDLYKEELDESGMFLFWERRDHVVWLRLLKPIGQGGFRCSIVVTRSSIAEAKFAQLKKEILAIRGLILRSS